MYDASNDNLTKRYSLFVQLEELNLKIKNLISDPHPGLITYAMAYDKLTKQRDELERKIVFGDY